MKYLKVRADGTHEAGEFESPVDYRLVQREVAAPDEKSPYFEVVGDDEVCIYMNENGKLLSLLANVPVTLFARERRLIFQHDVVVGDCLITGPADDEGYATDVTPEIVRQVLKHNQ